MAYNRRNTECNENNRGAKNAANVVKSPALFVLTRREIILSSKNVEIPYAQDVARPVRCFPAAGPNSISFSFSAAIRIIDSAVFYIIRITNALCQRFVGTWSGDRPEEIRTIRS